MAPHPCAQTVPVAASHTHSIASRTSPGALSLLSQSVTLPHPGGGGHSSHSSQNCSNFWIKAQFPNLLLDLRFQFAYNFLFFTEKNANDALIHAPYQCCMRKSFPRKRQNFSESETSTGELDGICTHRAPYFLSLSPTQYGRPRNSFTCFT